MSFGGGTFVTQNKILPGVYVNVSQQAKARSTLNDRGVAALGLELDWGPENQVFYVESSEFRRQANSLFGYAYSHPKLRGLRDLFLHAGGCYFYRLNGGQRAACEICEAKYSGSRGNDLVVNVSQVEGGWEVVTSLAGQEVDRQLVAKAADLLPNDFVSWKGGASLTQDACWQLTGGSNLEKVDTAVYQQMLEALADYSFHTLGCLALDNGVKALLAQFTREQREENGRKFQTVLYDYPANYEGVISLGSACQEADWPASSLVYWLLGAEAGCAVNASLTNAVYDGEFTPVAVSGQKALQEALLAGSLVFHRVNGEYRILEDVNSLQNWQESSLEDQRFNQTVRVLDQIVTDVAGLFYQRYLGQAPNDNAGRVSLWSDIIAYLHKLEGLRAIEAFSADDISVEQGDNKKSVVVSLALTVTNAMSQLYLTVTFA